MATSENKLDTPSVGGGWNKNKKKKQEGNSSYRQIEGAPTGEPMAVPEGARRDHAQAPNNLGAPPNEDQLQQQQNFQETVPEPDRNIGNGVTLEGQSLDTIIGAGTEGPNQVACTTWL